VATRLHNFVINNDGEQIVTQQEVETEVEIETQVETPIEIQEQDAMTTGADARRTKILDSIMEMGLQRPVENIDRNG
jgi:hypothetical protein